MCYLIEVRAVKGDEVLELGCSGGRVPPQAWRSGDGWGSPKILKWSELRAAVLAGFTPTATVALLPGRPCAGPGARLFESAPPSAAPRGAAGMLNGPYTDVAVLAAGGAFRAHRLVLAVASPVLQELLNETAYHPAAVEIEMQDASYAVAELLLNYIYGNAIEVPLPLALPLLELAARLRLRGDLGRRLRLWLSAIDVAPASLAALLPAAHRGARPACEASLYRQAARALPQIAQTPGFASEWPADVLAEVLARAPPAGGFAAAAAWLTAPGGAAAAAGPGGAAPLWGQLLASVRWDRATQAELRQIRVAGAALPGGAPGLDAALWGALDGLCSRGAAAVDRLLRRAAGGAAVADALGEGMVASDGALASEWDASGSDDDSASGSDSGSERGGGGPGRVGSGAGRRTSMLVKALANLHPSALTRRISNVAAGAAAPWRGGGGGGRRGGGGSGSESASASGSGSGSGSASDSGSGRSRGRGRGGRGARSRSPSASGSGSGSGSESDGGRRGRGGRR
ncbi:MAG: hypothetical protein J3K34DRAFT_441794 [Monoraphidium minutum]|nr:MAG: hypothetical protein J3K34DRAFT_441794 [Monoraphidium minutum]